MPIVLFELAPAINPQKSSWHVAINPEVKLTGCGVVMHSMGVHDMDLLELNVLVLAVCVDECALRRCYIVWMCIKYYFSSVVNFFNVMPILGKIAFFSSVSCRIVLFRLKGGA
jgi:hypothetical protein